jgi:osmotically-inducible protein OsmY
LTGGPVRGGTEEGRAAIQEALARQAERVAAGIELTVTEGKATVVGRVGSWSEKQAVLDALGAVAGIDSVVDQLRIDPEL